MSGREIESSGIAVPRLKPREQRRLDRAAAVRIASQVAAENPHPLDERMPRIAGQSIATNPAVRRELTELLDALGLKPHQIRRRP